jgi:hypothetical protein
MGIGTLLRYLIGDRAAILTIGRSRQALWMGFLFVLSAALARDYDGEDLIHEPWHLLLPPAASLASSFALFTLAYGVAAFKGASWSTFFPNYASFLGLFWMTAPLAWLYAIPYERFQSPVDAMRLNLITLGVVAVWRVALMVRVLMVILNYSVAQALFLVLLFGDAIALLLIRTLPFPLIDLMGGIRLTERDLFLRDVALTVALVGGCSLPVWGVGAPVLLFYSRPVWQVGRPPMAGGGSLRWLALASVLVWAAVLPWTQAEQIHKWRVEKAVTEKRFPEALAEMSRLNRSDFPPGWDPPPRRFNLEIDHDDFVGLLEEMARCEAPGPAEWVREAYLEKTVVFLVSGGSILTPMTLRPLAAALSHIPDGETVVARLEALGRSDVAKVLRDAWPSDAKEKK